MFYEFAISVPKSTTQGTPKTQKLRLAHGVIHRVEVQFPIGTQALAHARLEHHSFGGLPTNPQGNFCSDGYIIPVDEYLEFFSAPYEVTAILWNDDDTYAHTITFRFGIWESKIAVFIMSVFKGLAKFLKMVGIKV